MGFVLIWLFCGIIAGMIGSPKGEGCLSFALGILLGPFGILFAIFSKGNLKDCPFCTKRIPNQATVCPACHSSLTANTTPTAAAPSAQVSAPPMAVPTPPAPPQYFLFVGGQQTGPFSQTQIVQMASAGMVAPTSLVWAPGYADWVEVQSVFPQAFGSQGTSP
jgi:hypothetical protein